MMACTASPGRLFVAPFAVVGSIGVIGQSINIHKVLEGWGVTPLVFRGGKDKAPLGLIGEVTDESIAKVQGMVDTIHTAFKQHVAAARPIISDRIDELATGDVWLGKTAVEVGLADRVITSDEYISERMMEGACILKLIRYDRPRFPFISSSSSSRSGLVRSIFPLSLVHMVTLLHKFVGMLYSSLTNFKNRMPDTLWQ
jgi:serine protease SohB